MIPVLYGIASGLAVLIIQRFWVSAHQTINRQRVNNAFPVNGASVAVILGSKYFKSESSNQLLYVPLSGVSAYAKLSTLLNEYGSDIDFYVDENVPKDKKIVFEICIGGKNSNVRTEHYLDKYCARMFHPNGSTLNRNEARIVKLTIPFDDGRSKSVLIIYGQDRFDTMCAITYFCGYFDKLVRKKFAGDHAAVRLATDPQLGHFDAAYKEDDTHLMDLD